MRRLLRSPLSLIAAGRIFVVCVFMFSGIAGLLSWNFLSKIEADAAAIQDQQIPAVLSQNRNALKVEKLASLARSAFLARDSALERQIQLQVRILSQSFALDGDNVLTQGAAQMADGVKRIIGARVAERQAETETTVAPANANATAVVAYEQTMQLAEGLASKLSTGTARVADKISTDIQGTASSIRQAWLVILLVPLISILTLFAFFRAQVVRPIDQTVQRLAAIRDRRSMVRDGAVSWFADLRQIEQAVDAFAQMSEELYVKNEMLLVLSDQDPLTKVGNRRHFDTTLRSEIEKTELTGNTLALLLLDLDHFKRINDGHGHQTGDACLKTVGNVLATLCEGSGYLPARFGGEEFVVILPGAEMASAVIFAERLRVAIASVEVVVGHERSPVNFTTSIGVAVLRDVKPRSAMALIEAADSALYQAKRDGRNTVHCHGMNGQHRLRAVNS